MPNEILAAIAMSPAETAARAQGHTGLADVIRDICYRKVPSDSGKIPELAQMQKAELYLAHFGWHHACGHAPMPGSVADMARLTDLLLKPHMRWRAALGLLEMEKQLATVPDLTEAEKIAILNAEASDQRKREEYEARKATDRFVGERNQEPSP